MRVSLWFKGGRVGPRFLWIGSTRHRPLTPPVSLCLHVSLWPSSLCTCRSYSQDGWTGVFHDLQMRCFSRQRGIFVNEPYNFESRKGKYFIIAFTFHFLSRMSYVKNMVRIVGRLGRYYYVLKGYHAIEGRGMQWHVKNVVLSCSQAQSSLPCFTVIVFGQLHCHQHPLSWCQPRGIVFARA